VPLLMQRLAQARLEAQHAQLESAALRCRLQEETELRQDLERELEDTAAAAQELWESMQVRRLAAQPRLAVTAVPCCWQGATCCCRCMRSSNEQLGTNLHVLMRCNATRPHHCCDVLLRLPAGCVQRGCRQQGAQQGRQRGLR
jgi:hypothetical protein